MIKFIQYAFFCLFHFKESSQKMNMNMCHEISTIEIFQLEINRDDNEGVINRFKKYYIAFALIIVIILIWLLFAHFCNKFTGNPISKTVTSENQLLYLNFTVIIANHAMHSKSTTEIPSITMRTMATTTTTTITMRMKTTNRTPENLKTTAASTILKTYAVILLY